MQHNILQVVSFLVVRATPKRNVVVAVINRINEGVSGKNLAQIVKWNITIKVDAIIFCFWLIVNGN